MGSRLAGFVFRSALAGIAAFYVAENTEMTRTTAFLGLMLVIILLEYLRMRNEYTKARYDRIETEHEAFVEARRQDER